MENSQQRDCPVLIVAGLPVVVPCPNVFIRCGNPLPSHRSVLTQTAVKSTRANPLAEEGSPGKSDFFGASGPQGRGKQSFFSEIKLAYSHSKHPISLTGRKD